MEIGCSGICRILSGLSLIISMTVGERRKTFNTVTEHKTTGNTKTHIQRFELIRPGQKAPLDVMRKELKEIIREENEKAQTE